MVGILQIEYSISSTTDTDVNEALQKKKKEKNRQRLSYSLYSAIQLWMISIVCANRPYRYQPISVPLNSA